MLFSSEQAWSRPINKEIGQREIKDPDNNESRC